MESAGADCSPLHWAGPGEVVEFACTPNSRPYSQCARSKQSFAAILKGGSKAADVLRSITAPEGVTVLVRTRLALPTNLDLMAVAREGGITDYGAVPYAPVPDMEWQPAAGGGPWRRGPGGR